MSLIPTIELFILIAIVFTVTFSFFVLKVFSMQSAQKLKTVAFGLVANLILLPTVIYVWLFVIAGHNFMAKEDNWIFLWSIIIVLVVLSQIFIFKSNRNFKKSYEKKVADVLTFAIVLTSFVMYLFYKEAYYDFSLMNYVDVGIAWIFFCLTLYTLAKIFISEKGKRMNLWKRVILVSGVISMIFMYHIFFTLYSHSEPNLDPKELLICTDILGAHEQYGPWFKKSWRGICVQNELCAGPAGKTLQCDSELASLGKWSDSWQRTKITSLEIMPYKANGKGVFKKDNDVLGSPYVISDAYLFRTNKGAAFYSVKNGWVISKVDFDTFENMGGYYFKDKNKVFYKDNVLSEVDTKTVEFMGNYCIIDNNIFYQKGKKVESCK